MNKKLVGAVALCAASVVFLSVSKRPEPTFDDSREPTYMEDSSGAQLISDSEKETLKTLIAKVGRYEKNIKQIKDAQKKDMQELNLRFDSLQKVFEQKAGGNYSAANETLLTSIRESTDRKINELTQEIERLKANPPSPTDFTGGVVPVVIDEPTTKGTGSIPTLSQPGLGNGNKAPIIVAADSAQEANEDIVWIEPDDAIVAVNRDGAEEVTYPTDFEAKVTELSKKDNELNNLSVNGTTQKELKNIPMYTIPSNSTLLNAVGLTAIIGRVPMAGTLQNPFRFKVLLGQDNLATNGLTIPNLKSMVLAGTASGDFTMECAQGNIDKATFTFIDGTVRVMEGELGWISDEYGTPCISGQYISNFMSYVASVGSLSTLGSIAEAISQSNVSTITGTDGIASAVTGDTLQYGVGQGVNDGVQETIKWFADRQESAFDAVFLPVGKKLTVHIEETLEIDYETEGRKLVYDENVEKYL